MQVAESTRRIQEIRTRPLPKQMTLASTVTFEGKGAHSGKSVSINVHPAEIDTGYIFQRTDIKSAPIPARYNTVTDTRMQTVISNEDGISVATVEHLLAALSGSGITNAYIEINGPEVPIMDGSSYAFAKAFHEKGCKKQRASHDVLFVKKPFVYENGAGKISVFPSKTPVYMCRFDGYKRMDSLLTHRYAQFRVEHDSFLDLVSDARTFGFYEDGLYLQSRGLAQGASLENTVVIKDNAILNEEGLRSPDEFVRHKLLDLIGDFSLAGMQICGTVIGHNTGHSLNNQFLRAFMRAYDYWD